MTKDKIKTFQMVIGNQWVDVKQWYSLQTMVTYVNNYHGNNLSYNRTRHHLVKNGTYEFNMKNGKFTNRIILGDKDDLSQTCQSKEDGVCRLPINTCKQCSK